MRRVLIIEDDKSTNDRLCDYVKRIAETEVDQVFNRNDAAMAISQQSYEVAVVDIDLGPELLDNVGKYGGITLLSSLADRNVVTVVVSGITEENIAHIAIALKAYDFIAKPVEGIEFINKVRHALDHSSTRDSQRAADSQASWPPNLSPDPDVDLGLLWKGKRVHLSMTQLRLVRRLVKDFGSPVETAALAECLGTASSAGAVATHFTAVRGKFKDIDSDFNAIKSDPGRGYVWKST